MNVVHTGSFKMHYGWLRKCPVLYQYCHVNFLARRKGSRSAVEVPTLFFMECTVDEDENDELACWPVVTLSTDAGMLYDSPFFILLSSRSTGGVTCIALTSTLLSGAYQVTSTLWGVLVH
jgi:hypothetical protein